MFGFKFEKCKKYKYKRSKKCALYTALGGVKIKIVHIFLNFKFKLSIDMTFDFPITSPNLTKVTNYKNEKYLDD